MAYETARKTYMQELQKKVYLWKSSSKDYLRSVKLIHLKWRREASRQIKKNFKREYNLANERQKKLWANLKRFRNKNKELEEVKRRKVEELLEQVIKAEVEVVKPKPES